MSAKPIYRAFLLRLWQATDTEWHASLEDSHTGERHAFASLEQLADYLAQATQAGFAAAGREALDPKGETDVE